MLRPLLVVENEPIDQELILIALTYAGVLNDTIIVGGGEEALDYLYCRGTFAHRTPGNPALILLDLHMPDVDGFEVLRTVRGNPAHASIPVVILTAKTADADVVTAYKAGANAYVFKGTSPREFKDSLLHAVNFWAGVNRPPPNSVPFKPAKDEQTPGD